MTRSPDLSGPRIHAFHPSSVRGSSRRIPRASCGGERPRGTAPHGRRPRPRTALGGNARRAAHARVRARPRSQLHAARLRRGAPRLQRVGLCGALSDAALSGAPADQPHRRARHALGDGAPHSGLVRDEHEPAVLRGGDRRLGAHADRGASRAERALRRDGDRLRVCVHPRGRAAAHAGGGAGKTPPSPSGTPGGTCCASSFGCCSLWACSSGWASW